MIKTLPVASGVSPTNTSRVILGLVTIKTFHVERFNRCQVKRGRC
jgi:hypothetical protein